MAIFADRGASRSRTENTMGAFLDALGCGADGVVLQVQLTRDYEVVIFHDLDLRRLAGRHDRVETLTWRELSEINLFGGGRIPRLIDLLERWPTDRWLNIELLSSGGHELVARTLEVLVGRPRVILSSRDPKLLLHARGVGSRYSHALVLDATSSPFLHAGGARAYGCNAVHIDHRLCTPAVVERHRQRDMVVGAFTVRQYDRMQELSAMGVERLITDRP